MTQAGLTCSDRYRYRSRKKPTGCISGIMCSINTRSSPSDIIDITRELSRFAQRCLYVIEYIQNIRYVLSALNVI